MLLYLQSREFQRAKMRINAPQILKIRCKGNNIYANQHYFTTIISLSDSGVCPTASVPNPLLTRLAAMSSITQRHRAAVHTPPASQPRTQSGVN